MTQDLILSEPHPAGELTPTLKYLSPQIAQAVLVDTPAHRFHVEWDPDAPVTGMGNLVFFIQFLATAGVYQSWVAGCPVCYQSPNAPQKNDLLGTIFLSTVSGHRRYAHVTTLRNDKVNPVGLGMSRVCSEDSVRRAFEDEDPQELEQWQTKALEDSYKPALKHPWILDIDVTVKPIYGNQEGAQVGYNPKKPGRPSHVYHSYLMGDLRLVLDVEVHPGKKHAASHGFKRLWSLCDGFAADERPALIRGDCQYGQEHLMSEAEERNQHYVFRLRMTRRSKDLIRWMGQNGRWTDLGQGWSAQEGTLRLSGWSKARRVIVLRRLKRVDKAPDSERQLEWNVLTADAVEYEYMVLVTNTILGLVEVADLYRQRSSMENVFDEIKNQWGWGGYTTQDLLRCQVAARNVALIYNWWTLFVRCAQPTKAMEAIRSRPLLLSAVGRVIRHSGQTILRLTSMHGQSSMAQELLNGVSLFLSGLKNTAEQLSSQDCWQRIWDRILAPFLHSKGALPAPT